MMNQVTMLITVGIVSVLLSIPVSSFTLLKRRLSASSITTCQGSNKRNPALYASGSDFSELTSNLARLDQQWNIQQASRNEKSRWSKVVLPVEEGTDDGQETDENEKPNDAKQDEYVWVLEPPSNTIPSCAIVFTGGAALGQFPHIAYNELLLRISDKLNAVCIAAPYSVGLDHFSLAKDNGDLLRRALVHLEEDSSRNYPTSLPTYCLAHSLGGKLQTIYLAATGQEFTGIGLMSFNNFSFADTISMAKMFAAELRNSNGDRRSDGKKSFSNFIENEEVMDTLFGFAETIVGTIGVDFAPNAGDMKRLIQLRYNKKLQEQTRLFVFDEDNLDNSEDFIDNCQGVEQELASSGLPGGHLAPVFFKLGLNDFDMNEIPTEAREMAVDAIGGFKSASFGDETALNELVSEVCGWILGKPPTREPRWRSTARNTPHALLDSESE